MQPISSIKELQNLYYLLRSFSIVKNRSDFLLDLPMLSRTTNHLISQRLNNYKNACGCFTGGLFLGISVILLSIYFIFGNISFSENILQIVFSSVGFVIGSSLLGKISGLIWARFRMIQLLGNLMFLIKQPEYLINSNKGG
jgi:hypothetical protein